jgi:hypothetical protein
MLPVEDSNLGLRIQSPVSMPSWTNGHRIALLLLAAGVGCPRVERGVFRSRSGWVGRLPRIRGADGRRVFLQHPREDSNLDLDVRSVALCPLSYRGQLLLVPGAPARARWWGADSNRHSRKASGLQPSGLNQCPAPPWVLSVCSAVELSTNERPQKMKLTNSGVHLHYWAHQIEKPPRSVSRWAAPCHDVGYVMVESLYCSAAAAADRRSHCGGCPTSARQ